MKKSTVLKKVSVMIMTCALFLSMSTVAVYADEDTTSPFSESNSTGAIEFNYTIGGNMDGTAYNPSGGDIVSSSYVYLLDNNVMSNFTKDNNSSGDVGDYLSNASPKILWKAPIDSSTLQIVNHTTDGDKRIVSRIYNTGDMKRYDVAPQYKNSKGEPDWNALVQAGKAQGDSTNGYTYTPSDVYTELVTGSSAPIVMKPLNADGSNEEGIYKACTSGSPLELSWKFSDLDKDAQSSFGVSDYSTPVSGIYMTSDHSELSAAGMEKYTGLSRRFMVKASPSDKGYYIGTLHFSFSIEE